MAACCVCSHRERESPFHRPMPSLPWFAKDISGKRLRPPTTESGPTLLHFVNRPTLVVAAVRTSTVWLLHFVAIGTLRQGRFREEIVSAPGAGAPLGMSSLWIRHCITPSFTPLDAKGGMVQRSFTRNVQKSTARFLQTGPKNTHLNKRHSRVPTNLLLLLEPVLLQPGKGSQPGIARMRFAAADLVIQAGAACRTQSAAIALADYFHR